MWYENGWIRVRKHDKSAYAVIIMDFPCTLPYANKLIYAVTRPAFLPDRRVVCVDAGTQVNTE